MYKDTGKLNICTKNFNFIEKLKVLLRDLEVIRHSLESTKTLLKNKHLKWHTDKYSSRIIAKSEGNEIGL